MALATRPLLELFATVDEVFAEPDAFDPAKARMTIGRIYEQWKKTRSQLDPDFEEKRYRKPT